MPTPSYPDEEQLAHPLQMDGQVAGADFTLGAVDDAVFQNGLHGQLGQAAVVNFLPVPAVALDGQLQALGKAVALDFKVSLAVLQLLLHRHQVFHLADGVAEKAGQGFGHVRQRRQPGGEGFAADALQRVVEEVRVDLVLQGEILGLALVQLQQLGGVQHLPQALLHLPPAGGGEDVPIVGGAALQKQAGVPLQPAEGPEYPKDGCPEQGGQQGGVQQRRRCPSRQQPAGQISKFLLTHGPPPLSVEPAELRRVHAGHFVEGLGEVLPVAVAHRLAYLGDRQVSLPQQLLGAVHAHLCEVLGKALARPRWPQRA